MFLNTLLEFCGNSWGLGDWELELMITVDVPATLSPLTLSFEVVAVIGGALGTKQAQEMC